MTYSVVCKEKNMAVESRSVSCKRSRKSNWNVRDEIVVVEVVEKRKDVLFGQLTGSGRTALDKAKAWQEVANVVNLCVNMPLKSNSKLFRNSDLELFYTKIIT